MIRVAAQRHTTQVVERESCSDWSDEHLVDDTMDEVSLVVEGDVPVAVRRRSGPQPAWTGGVDAIPQASFKWGRSHG
jgi:hypothetical protein